MLKEYYKNGKVFDFETNPFCCGIKDREKILIDEGYMPVFDKRDLYFNNSLRCGTLILENDLFTPQTLRNFQSVIDGYGNKSHVSKQITCLHPNHMPIIIELLKSITYGGSGLIKNILIDSLFSNIDQFRGLINKLFANYTNLNFFIDSHGTLIRTLNDELKNHMDKYPIRNSYYKNFNELTFTLLKNNIYEIEFDAESRIDTLHKIVYDSIENKVSYEYKYKYMIGQYTVDIIDTKESTSKKTKW